MGIKKYGRFYNNGSYVKYSLTILMLFIYSLESFMGWSMEPYPIFKSLTKNDGLSSMMINTISKDRRGFIWIGTVSGLNRYDGYEIKTYKSFENEVITAIKEVDPENLLIGTEKGIYVFNKRTESKTIVSDSLHLRVNDVSVIAKDRYWGCTEQGLYYIENKKAKKIVLDSEISYANKVTSSLRENDSIFWFATNDGLCRYNINNSKKRIYRNTSSSRNYNLFTSLALYNSVIYAGTFNKGVFAFSLKTEKFEPVPLLRDEYVKCIAVDKNGIMYVGTNGKGLKVFDPAHNTLLTYLHNPEDNYSISSNAVYTVLSDGNRCWVGTYSGGISYNFNVDDPVKIYKYLDFNSANYNVRSMLIMNNGDKMIGTRTGLIYVSEKKKKVRKYSINDYKPVLRSDIILFVYPYKGNILVGTYGGGMYRFDPDTETLSDWVLKDEVFVSGCVFNMTEDTKGNLWIGTNEGLWCYNGDTRQIRHYNNTNSALPDNTVSFVMNDAKDRMWVGLVYAEACVLDLNTDIMHTRPIPDKYSIYGKNTQGGVVDSEDNIWIASPDGLLKINTDFTRVTRYTNKDFLPENWVKAIVEDKDHNLWITTMGYVMKYDPKTKKRRLYRNAISADANFNNGCILTADGRIWWTNERGLLYLDITEEKQNMEYARPYITSFSTSDLSSSGADNWVAPEYRDQIDLTITDNSVSINFSYLSYTLSGAFYEYKLEGFDDEWETVSTNKVTYKELPVGKYLFKLRYPGMPETETSIPVVVHWTYNLIIWLFLIILLISLLLLFFMKSNRLRKLSALTKEITRGVTREAKKMAERNVTVNSDNASCIEAALLEQMEKNKLYLNPDLKANDVAVAIQCSVLELSQVLNVYLNIGFTDFVNKYRVEEFKNYINKESLSKYTLIGISEKCGFNSRSTFYRAVKKVTGKSPAEFVDDFKSQIK